MEDSSRKEEAPGHLPEHVVDVIPGLRESSYSDAVFAALERAESVLIAVQCSTENGQFTLAHDVINNMRWSVEGNLALIRKILEHDFPSPPGAAVESTA